MKPRKQKNKQSRRPDVKRKGGDIHRIQKKPQSQKNSKPNKSASKLPFKPAALPFEPKDHILLFGEGDFSFSRSLVENELIHASNKLVCTSYESAESLYEKYPQSREAVSYLQGEGHTVLFSVDATKGNKLPKIVRKRKFDSVIFNFPHTGGLTTDVHRQIRANQELLVGFFKTAKGLLNRPVRIPMAVQQRDAFSDDDNDDEEEEVESSGCKYGSIAVTIFEGKPYEDWNIKELARSCGLKTQRAFKFDAGRYTGYKHALTIGHRERDNENSSRKSENKPARTYIFEAEEAGKSAGKKHDSSDSE